MFVRRSRYTALHRRYQQVIAQRGDAIDAAVGHVREIARLAQVVDALREQVDPRVTERLEAALADARAERRRADRLQQQLDDALGLNQPAVAAGEHWQTRRDQKMRFDK